jgi:hypothetical protein
MPTRRTESPELTNLRGQAAVEQALAARGGMSRADLMSDKDRGPVSSLGHGTGSKKETKKGKK